MKYTKLSLALVFLFNILFATESYAVTSPHPVVLDKISLASNFKNLETFLNFMKIRYTKEEISFLRNRLLAAGYELNQPLDFKINFENKTVFVPKIGKTLTINDNNTVAVDGLIFELNSSLPLDQNLRSFEKLLKQKGFGKIEIGFSTSEADEIATWAVVAGTAAAIAIVAFLAKHPLIAALVLSLGSVTSYLLWENTPTPSPPRAPSGLTQKDFIKALNLLQEIRCNSNSQQLGKGPFNEHTVLFKDGAKAVIKINNAGVLGAVTKYNKAGDTEYPVRLPENDRVKIGALLKEYCASSSAEMAKLPETLGKIKEAFAYSIDNSNAQPARAQ